VNWGTRRLGSSTFRLSRMLHIPQLHFDSTVKRRRLQLMQPEVRHPNFIQLFHCSKCLDFHYILTIRPFTAIHNHSQPWTSTVNTKAIALCSSLYSLLIFRYSKWNVVDLCNYIPCCFNLDLEGNRRTKVDIIFFIFIRRGSNYM